jgi:hypothetical protein
MWHMQLSEKNMSFSTIEIVERLPVIQTGSAA